MGWFTSCEHEFEGFLKTTGFFSNYTENYHKCRKCGKEEKCYYGGTATAGSDPYCYCGGCKGSIVGK